jgi:photosystem II stability/assembly factor-like uncharacterized protein
MKSLGHSWPKRALRFLLVAAAATLIPLSPLNSGSAATVDGWSNVTSNLANMPSQCGSLGLVSAVPGSNTVIAGVAQQGLWATTDGGASWKPLGVAQGSARITNRPYSISYDPASPARFYESGNYGDGVFATTNGGTTFAQLGKTAHDDFISIDYTDPDRKTLLAGGHEQSRTVWKSTDGGKSWTNVGVNLPSGTGYSSDPLIIDAHTYLVNTANSGGAPGIFRTTDGGTTWTSVSSLGPNGPPLVASDGTIYWPVDNALAKSSDHGLTWSLVSSGFVNGLHPIEVSGGRLVTAGANSLWVSSDGGTSWDALGPSLPYVPTGVVYSENQKALFIWHGDCGTRVLPDAIEKLSYDFAALPVGPRPATVQLLANWVSPTYLASGQTLTVHQDMFSNRNVNLTLSADIFDSQGQLVVHSSLDDQAVVAQQRTPLTLTIALPRSIPSGTYTVKTAALGPDGNVYAESDSAGKFVAFAPPPTPTPVPIDETVDNSTS